MWKWRLERYNRKFTLRTSLYINQKQKILELVLEIDNRPFKLEHIINTSEDCNKVQMRNKKESKGGYNTTVHIVRINE